MIQLSKGGNINLAKEANGVTEFSIGLGWDVAAQAALMVCTPSLWMKIIIFTILRMQNSF